jgi:hypothetical protein
MRWGAIRDLIRYRVQVFNKNSDGYKNVLFIRVFLEYSIQNKHMLGV